MSIKAKVEAIPGYNSLVRPVHFAQAVVAAVRSGLPARKMKVIAVTGTNGKTSTCFFIWKMLSNAGLKTGILTTVAWGGVNGALNPQYEHMTTEKVGVLMQRIKAIKDAGAEYLVIEVTSHALMQSRILGVPVDIAVFTNLTHEHLDYHGTFENYRKAKMKLFRKAKFGIVNADDDNAKYFGQAIRGDKNPSGDIISYGIRRGMVRAREVELLDDGVQYSCGDIKIRTQIPGEFMVYNSLAAVCVGRKIGLGNRQIEQGIAALEGVEGRMTKIENVIVDYAHTPDALENVLRSVGARSKITSDQAILQRIIAVHGGAGRRDESTREPRGEILGRYSDIVIITEDDSRDEDPGKIAEAFRRGAEKAGKVLGKDLFVELDRRKAIEMALDRAGPGDIVMVLGKGHEKTILRADGPHEFEDIKVVKEIIKNKKEGQK